MLNNYQQVIEQIKKAENILIVFPAHKNGEAIASALALDAALKKIKKNNDILTKVPKENEIRKLNKIFSFLPGFKRIQTSPEALKQFVISLSLSQAQVKQVKYRIEKNHLRFLITPKRGIFAPEDVSAESLELKYDLIITLNTPDLESLEEIYEDNTELFYNTPVINIDNSSANEEFGEINLVELTSASTAEIIFNLFREGLLEETIDEDIATCLLSGITYKTKNFKTLNITPNALKTTSELISLGARREEILNRLYRSKELNSLKLWGRVLARLSGTEDNKLIWSTLPASDFAKTGSSPEDIEDIIEELVSNIPEAEVAIIFYESPTSIEAEEQEDPSRTSPYIRAVVYSNKNIDLKEILKDYSPRGKERIIKIETDTSLRDAKREILPYLQEKIKELSL